MMMYDNRHYIPPNWPATPFHKGELEVQKSLGVLEHVGSYAPRFIRPYMPEQHRDFFTAQPFLVVAARDDRGKMWSSLIFAGSDPSTNEFITSPDPKTLTMESQPLRGDALENQLSSGSDLGILGIEFATRRRNRVNGRIAMNDGKKIQFQVDQSFGNCPQYIKSRDWSWIENKSLEKPDENYSDCSVVHALPRSTQVSPEQIRTIQKAETMFLATGYRGEGEDPRYGNDASHRGGPPGGFVQVGNGGKTLYLPDYSGNNHYNTIGNLVLDPRMGITIPLFETGGILQLSGRVTIRWSQEESTVIFPTGALRMLEFTVDEIVEIPAGSLPIQWHTSGDSDLQLQVVEKVRESHDVTSFYLAPVEEEKDLPAFKPGQHIEMSIRTGKDNNERITRSYSLSSYDRVGNNYYRISVKRDPFGIGSNHLHDNVHTGDVLDVQTPAGDFGLPDPSDAADTLVLMSAGIGATPILSMLHSLKGASTSMSTSSFSSPSSSSLLVPNYKRVVWVHTERNSIHHAFQEEAKELSKLIGNKLTTHVVYTSPNESDQSHYDSQGRMTLDRLGRLLKAEIGLSEETSSSRKVSIDSFLCGPGGFVGTMEDHLKSLGVDEERINSESF